MKKIAKLSLSLALLFTFITFYQANFNATSLLKLSFELNGGDISTQPPTQQYLAGTEIIVDTLPKPSRNGYSFIGWSYENTILETSFIMPNKAVTLIATWLGDDQPVTFDPLLQAVAHLPEAMSLPIDSTLSLDTLSIPTHERYQFSGWLLSEKLVQHTVIISQGGLKFTPKWTGSFETITFDLNDGSHTILEDKIEEPVGTSILLTSLPTPTRPGYSFNGWSYKTQPITKTFKILEGGMILEANWLPLTEGITLHAEQTAVTIEAKRNEKINIKELFGLTATDTIDGNLTTSIQHIPLSIASHVPGVYQIIATVANSRQKQAQQLLLLTIVDTTAPTISLDQPTISLPVGTLLPDNPLSLFSYTIEDTIDYGNVVISLDQDKPIDTHMPKTNIITGSVSDQSGNVVTFELTIIIMPLTFSGTIFLDINKNHLNDDDSVLSGQELLLILDNDTKTIVDRTTTDNNGNYTLTSPQNPQSEIFNYLVCSSTQNNYVLTEQHTYNLLTKYSNFNPSSGCSEVFEEQGVNYKNVNLGLHKNVEVLLPRTTLALKVNQQEQLDIIISNGSIASVNTSNDNLHIYSRQNNLLIQAKQSGETILTVHFNDVYGREISMTKQIIITTR